MDNGKWLQTANDSLQIAKVKAANDYTKRFGLALTDEETAFLIRERKEDMFYLYKNESLDEITDDELIEFMKDQFDGPCQGSLDHLEDTGLEAFARRIRLGLDLYEEEDDEF